MTIAELHGKLAPERPNGVHEQLEDLLTSDVFGTMKYAGWEHGFLDWLLQAEPAPVEPAPPPISTYLAAGRISYVDYAFWPTLKNKREPDVALLFRIEERYPVVVLVEAKYMSGTSDWEGEEDADPWALTGNQIADQVRGLHQMAAEEVLTWFESTPTWQEMNRRQGIQKIHLFLTMHTRMPARQYELSQQKLPTPWPVPAYWLSWTSLPEMLQSHLDQSDRHLAALIGDLHKLLRRKRLVPFRGFSLKPWQRASNESSFWQETWWSFGPPKLGPYERFWT